MGKAQLISGSKVKLKLVQPNIKCIGRDDVTCHYRGKIIETLEDSILIEFKYKGKLERQLYYFNFPNLGEGFYKESLRDIKII